MEHSTTKTKLQTAAALQFQYLRTGRAVFTKLAVINPSFCSTVLNSVDLSFTASDVGSCHYQHDNTAGDSFGIHFVPWTRCS